MSWGRSLEVRCCSARLSSNLLPPSLPGPAREAVGTARPLPAPRPPCSARAAALWRRPRSAGEGCGRLAAAEGRHARILITTSTGACQGPAAPANHRVRGAGGEEARGPGGQRGGRGGSLSGGSSGGREEAGPAQPGAPPAPPRLLFRRVPARHAAPRAPAARSACGFPTACCAVPGPRVSPGWCSCARRHRAPMKGPRGTSRPARRR